jgi:hypothetical protein
MSVAEILPVLDTYARLVWPAVITCWLAMGMSDVRRRFFSGEPA